MLLFIYPVIALPVLLAFLARYALQSDVAFYGVLIVVATTGALIYRFALNATVGHVERNRERLLEQLSVGEGPVSS
jgi:ABC-2 type transport system permease protein